MQQDSNNALLAAPELDWPDNAPVVEYWAEQNSAREIPVGETANFRCLLLLAGALLIPMAGPFLVGKVYTADDLGAFHLPMRAFYSECLHRGEAFDWSPQMYCGFYATGEGQVGGYHPLHWLMYRWLPLPTAFGLECLLGYPLMLAGMYFWLRRWLLRRDAAMFGAIAFAFSGFCMLHFVHPNAVQVVAHIPWLLWAIHGVVNDRSKQPRVLAGCMLALLTASQWLLGYPQYVWYSAIVEIGYAALLIWAPHSDRMRIGSALRCWATLGCWGVLGTLIGAVQLLPTLTALHDSSRQIVGSEFSGWGSLSPLNLVQLVAPYLFSLRVAGQNTHELGLYSGAGTLLLAACCFIKRTQVDGFRRLRFGACLLVGCGLLLALGEYGPFGSLLAHVPLLSSFRFPCRAVVLMNLGIAVLAAIGFQRLAEHQWAYGQEAFRVGKRIFAIAAAGIVLALIGPLCWPDHVAAPSMIWTGPMLFVASLLLIQRAEQRRSWALPVLCVLTAVDLGVYGMSYAVYGPRQELSQFVAAVPTPPGRPESRVALDLATPNQPGLRSGNEILMTGWRRVDGYAGLEPARRLDYRQAASLRVAGVEWIVGRASQPVAGQRTGWAARPTEAADGWQRLPNPLPRARLVTQAIVAENAAAAIPRIPLDTAVIVDHPLDLQPGVAGSAEIVADRPGDIRLRVAAPGRQLLVLAESFHSGWRADADGHAVPVVRTNGDFLGCVVESGTREVRFHFAPASLRYGRSISIFGLFLLGAAIVVAVMAKPRDGVPGY